MISMDLRVLRYFLTVAKEQNFTRAAEQLHITQPTLSRQLAAFEQELGVSLFDRTGKTITLTSEGILLKRRALEMLDIEERTLEELKPSKERIEERRVQQVQHLESERTVKNHISNIFKKIDVSDRTQAAVFAIKNDIITLK